MPPTADSPTLSEKRVPAKPPAWQREAINGLMTRYALAMLAAYACHWVIVRVWIAWQGSASGSGMWAAACFGVALTARGAYLQGIRDGREHREDEDEPPTA